MFERTRELTVANQRLTALNEELVNNARKLEEEIERRRESDLALQVAEQKTVNILESISDAFYALDREWRYTYVNAEARRQLGMQDASEVIGQVVWDVFPNYYNIVYEMFHKAISEQIPVRFERIRRSLGDGMICMPILRRMVSQSISSTSPSEKRPRKNCKNRSRISPIF